MSKSVMLLGEGNYPYAGGGVSTWCHSLCNKLKHIKFSLFSLTAQAEEETIYDLPKNVEKVTQVPLWSIEEPIEMFNYQNRYFNNVLKKERTVEDTINKEFIPIFDKFITAIYYGETHADYLHSIFIQLHEYFVKHDYKLTLYSEPVWDYFITQINSFATRDKKLKSVKISEIVIALRWLYRFLVPITIGVEKRDIYHVTMSGFPVLPAIVSKHKYGSAIMLTEHGVYIRERMIALGTSEFSYFLKKFLINLSEIVARVAYYKADVVVSVNKYNLKWAEMYGADPNKCRVVYNGVDEELFIPREKHKKHKNYKTVVAAARIFELKDIITMIKSCEVVKNAIPNVKYIVYGNKDAVPEYTKECEALIKKLGLEENFLLEGFHSQPHMIFSEGDISILTSISEGFPYTIIESMSCGIPVVATDVGGVSEAIDNGIDGFICKPKDYKDIGEKVIKLLKNKELRENMAKKAREKVLHEFTLDGIMEKYNELYQSIA